SGPPLMPKQAASNSTESKSICASAHAARRLSVTARSSLARPSAAAAWLHGPPSPVPRTRPVSSPITAVVPDCPPSTPRNSCTHPLSAGLIFLHMVWTQRQQGAVIDAPGMQARSSAEECTEIELVHCPTESTTFVMWVVRSFLAA